MRSLSETMKEIMKGQNIGPAYEETMRQVFADPDVASFLNKNSQILSKEAINRGEAKL